MQALIIYPTDNGIAIITPMDPSFPMYEMALRDVPQGKPFVFIDAADLPDYDFREAFTHDFKQPDGIGLGYENYMKRLENQNNQKIDLEMKKQLMEKLKEKSAMSHAPEPPKPPRSKRKKVNPDE